MQQVPRDLTREELVSVLRKAGARVTPAQLHRWTDAGLLPRPERRGLGKGGGKGTASWYSPTAVPQAIALHEALRLKRNLDDAAWMIWVFGFPVTGYVRELLVDEWSAEERRLRRTVKALTRADVRKSAIRALGRRPGDLRGALSMIPAQQMLTVFRMLAEMQYGELKAGSYDRSDWDRLRDAYVGLFGEDSVDETLPVDRIERDAVERSRQVPFRRLIAAINEIGDEELVVYRNELQEMHALVARQTGQEPGIVTRTAFRHYFGERVVDTERAPQVVEVIKQLGWTAPPMSQLDRLVEAAHEQLKKSP